MRLSIRALLLRLPLLLVFAFWAVVLLSLPLVGFTSDVSIIGYMGDDLAHGEMWPIIMYGTDKQITSTPYLYALVAALTGDSLERLSILKLSGLAFSLAGIWLFHEALLLSLRLKNRSHNLMLVSSVAFCLVVGSNVAFLVSLGDVSLTEQYHFCIGLQVFLTALLCRRLSEESHVPIWLWASFGAALSYSYVVRPNAFLFGIAGCGLLFLFYWRLMLKWATFLSFLFGFALAYTPMLWHKIFRSESWPVGARVPPLTLSSATEVTEQFWALTTQALAYLFLFDQQSMSLSTVQAIWCLLGLGGLSWLMRSGLRSKERSPLVIEGTLWGGCFLVLGLMLLVRGLCVDWASSRYCLALVPVIAWWVVVGLVRGKRSALLILSLSIVLTALQAPALVARLKTETVRATLQADSIDQLNEKYPGRLFFAEFWDAYELDFCSSGAPRMIPFPFESTRLFGRYAPQVRREKPLWLVEASQVEQVKGRVHEFIPEMRFVELEALAIQGKPYRILETESGSGADLFQRAQPQYLVPQPTLPSWASPGRLTLVKSLSVGDGALRLPDSLAIQSPASQAETHIMAYGPYLPLHPGNYLAKYRLKVGKEQSQGRLLCEVVQAESQLAQQSVEVNSAQLDDDLVLELPFRVDFAEPRQSLEFRVWKTGRFSLTLLDIELSER